MMVVVLNFARVRVSRRRMFFLFVYVIRIFFISKIKFRGRYRFSGWGNRCYFFVGKVENSGYFVVDIS